MRTREVGPLIPCDSEPSSILAFSQGLNSCPLPQHWVLWSPLGRMYRNFAGGPPKSTPINCWWEKNWDFPEICTLNQPISYLGVYPKEINHMWKKIKAWLPGFRVREGWVGEAQRAVKILCLILEGWTHINIHLSKPIEDIIPTVNPNVNCGL